MIESTSPLATVDVQPPPPVTPASAPLAHPLEFTGTGGEYFRIWVVNLLLTVVTLGIYSAWAKVRKTRYFWTNTRLDGAAFQYHGDPAAILRGRVVVGALLVLYFVAGQFSLRAGAAVTVALAAVAPWLFLKAMQFKLSNTSWRGVRFGFDSTVGAAYSAVAPGLAIWVILLVQFAAITPGDPPRFPWLFGLYVVAMALAPMLHARIKRYQHGAATYGSVRFEMAPCTRAYYGLYGRTALVAVALASGEGIVIAVVAILAGGSSGGDRPPSAVAVMPSVAFLLVYATAGVFFAARGQRLVWSSTRAGPVRFSSSISAARLMAVWLKNGLLTVLTLGLYWPFAAVNIARYRISSMTVEADGPFAEIAAGAGTVEPSSAGDGAVDLLGWDLGL